MKTGCNPSPDLKRILETTILSISRGLPRLREITKTKDDFCRQRWRDPLSCFKAPPKKKIKMPKANIQKPDGTIYMYKQYK